MLSLKLGQIKPIFRQFFFLALFLSLLSHIILVTLIYSIPSKEFDISQWKKKNSVEIDLISKSKLHHKKTYIKDPEVMDDELIKRINEKVNLLSQKSRRVKKQSVAKRVGKDKNVLKPQTPSSSALRNKSKLKLSKGGAPPKPYKGNSHLFASRLLKEGLPTNKKGKNARKSPFLSLSIEEGANKNLGLSLDLMNLRLQTSSISTYHPGIKTADITALDTDKGSLRYYTFHLRLREQLRLRWIELLEEVIRGVPLSTLHRMGRVPRVTTLEVILDPEGQYIGSILVESSSERLLDRAAKDSFKKAAPFVNPPSDMVEEDGYIYLPFSFRVDLNTRHLARSR